MADVFSYKGILLKYQLSFLEILAKDHDSPVFFSSRMISPFVSPIYFEQLIPLVKLKYFFSFPFFFQAVKGDGCHRKIKHILEYLLGMKDFQDMFAGEENPTLRLRFAGDGRKTSKKIGTVMGVFSVLQEAEKGLHRPNYQYTACLYNGKSSHVVSSF